MINTIQPAGVVGKVKAIPTSLPNIGRNTKDMKDIISTELLVTLEKKTHYLDYIHLKEILVDK